MNTLLILLAVYLLAAHLSAPRDRVVHIWVHALYVIFPYEPKWLERLHDRTGDKLADRHERSAAPAAPQASR